MKQTSATIYHHHRLKHHVGLPLSNHRQDLPGHKQSPSVMS